MCLLPSVRQSLLAQVSHTAFHATQYRHLNLLLVVTRILCVCSGLWSPPAPWKQVYLILAISWRPSCPPPFWRSCLASSSSWDDLRICPLMFKVPSTCPIRERCKNKPLYLLFLVSLVRIFLFIILLNSITFKTEAFFVCHSQIFPPSWHLLHLHLDVHWSILEILHLLGHKLQGRNGILTIHSRSTLIPLYFQMKEVNINPSLNSVKV